MTRSARVRMLVSAAAAAALTMSSSAAYAAGDPTLDALIVKNPVPGWTPMPRAAAQEIVSLEQRALSSIAEKSVNVAVQGWQNGNDTLLVIIANLQNEIPRAEREARQGVISACTTASNNPPKSVGNYAAIPGASEAVCEGRNAAGDAITATAMAWVDTNLFTIIIAGGLPHTQVESIAVRQNAAIPAEGLQQEPSSSSTTTTPASPSTTTLGPSTGSQSHSSGSNAALVAAVAGGGGALVGLLIILLARSRKRPQPPAQPAGWHPVDGDPSQYAYWDGTNWTARRHWNGTEWVESPPGTA